MINKSKVTSFYLVPIISIGFYFYPIFVACFLFFISYLVSNRKLNIVSCISLSLTIALLSQVFNIYGDASTYYYSYLWNDVNLLNGKIFRYVYFYFSSGVLNPKNYSFICLFLSIFFLIKTLNIYFSMFNVTAKLKTKILYIILVFYVFQWSYVTTYENIFAFIVFSYAQALFFLKNKKILPLILSFLSISIHLSSLLFIVYSLIVFILKSKSNKIIIFIGLLIPFSFILILSSGRDLPFLDIYMSKFYSYSQGIWSNYTTTNDYIILVLMIIKMICLIICIITIIKNGKYKDNVYVKFCILMLPIFVWFLCYRTISMRYVYSGSIFFIYVFLIIIYGLENINIKIKIFVIFVILSNTLSPISMQGLNGLISNINYNVLSGDIITIFSDDIIIDNGERTVN
ncbi:hypothetical protein HPQ32_19170 [Photobacterium carnosum]|uniref:EpsG family protein n=1 Tax=Photobacterium carnosum TaxID=2023717 RepID=UPI001C90663A|nr:EpsG family protein [Photobacterium carnosum]MBY3790482.1 hypothetical protein [Photobacterium carnosum]MCD9535525.1 hypothetical protein [Photobacterium carnosum]